MSKTRIQACPEDLQTWQLPWPLYPQLLPESLTSKGLMRWLCRESAPHGTSSAEAQVRGTKENELGLCRSPFPMRTPRAEGCRSLPRCASHAYCQGFQQVLRLHLQSQTLWDHDKGFKPFPEAPACNAFNSHIAACVLNHFQRSACLLSAARGFGWQAGLKSQAPVLEALLVEVG